VLHIRLWQHDREFRFPEGRRDFNCVFPTWRYTIFDFLFRLWLKESFKYISRIYQIIPASFILLKLLNSFLLGEFMSFLLLFACLTQGLPYLDRHNITWAISPAFFALVVYFFQVGSQGWPQTMILLTSAFWVPEIADVSCRPQPGIPYWAQIVSSQPTRSIQFYDRPERLF
jgi:hypothetical protein